MGVMQVLNKKDGVFDEDDEAVATALASQCAVALQRVRMTGRADRRREDAAGARDGARSPDEHAAGDDAGDSRLRRMRIVPSRRAHRRRHVRFVAARHRTPRSCSPMPPGHGIAPALSVTQMQAMFRIAFQLGANLESRVHGGQQPPRDRRWRRTGSSPHSSDFSIRRRIGLSFHSGGQAPILHYQAAAEACVPYMPTSFPLGAMPLTKLKPAVTIELLAGRCPGPALRRLLRVSRCRWRAVRRGAGAGHRRGPTATRRWPI